MSLQNNTLLQSAQKIGLQRKRSSFLGADSFWCFSSTKPQGRLGVDKKFFGKRKNLLPPIQEHPYGMQRPFLHPSFSVQNRPQLDKWALSSYDIDGSSKTGELLMDRCLPASGGDNRNGKFIANIINLQDPSAVPESCRKYRIGDAP